MYPILSLLLSYRDHAALQSTLWVTSVRASSWPRPPVKKVASPPAQGHHLQPLPLISNLPLTQRVILLQLQHGQGLLTLLELLWVVWGKPESPQWLTLMSCFVCQIWYALILNLHWYFKCDFTIIPSIGNIVSPTVQHNHYIKKCNVTTCVFTLFPKWFMLCVQYNMFILYY